ncbi:MAG: CheR family methyltransferase [Sulfurimonas sp.]
MAKKKVDNNYANLTIVGLGASAGGFEALQKFIQNIEPSERIAYVIVQHLDPKQPTLLGTLLERSSKIPIIAVTDGLSPLADHIYYCPPNSDIMIENGRFQLVAPSLKPYPKPSVNRFLKSLALEKKEKAIGIILSGTGSDGAEGIVAIKQGGGIALAENEDAKYFSMPKAAIDTHAVDAVLPSELLAQGIPYAIDDPKYFDRHFDLLDNIDKVFRLLNQKSEVDFSDYKENTIHRRLERRIIDTKSESVNDYIDLLQRSPAEIMNLKKELLIIVTSLFRDKEAFKALEVEVERLLEEKLDNHLRVWVAACATGDEAYSLAIVISETLKKMGLTKKVTIFATDVSEEAIDEARSRSFNHEEVSEVDAHILETYFVDNNRRYTPAKTIRDMIVFSKHDVIKDPPFLNLDLVSCRNLLIYFNSDLQQRVMSIFSYALRYQGLMFLGLSETIGNLISIFSIIDNKHKIYRKSNDMGNVDIEALAYFQKKDFQRGSRKLRDEVNALDINGSINNAVAGFFAKNGLVVDSGGSILFFKGDNKYISHPSGIATNDIYKQIADFLRLDLRATLNESVRNECVSVSKKIRVMPLTDDRVYITISVFPLPRNKLSENSYFIIFDEINETDRSVLFSHQMQVHDINDVNILENELTALKERLQITIEELETSNEELQSTNEELQSTNEELQSTNEELETSNEELQSTNEELHTVNDELEHKNKELAFVNEALNKVVEVINTEVLILDKNLDLFLHTKGMERFFKINYTHKINLSEIIINAIVSIPNLFENVKNVVQNKTEVEYDLIVDNRIYWFQIKSINFSSDDFGVIIGFTDKTDIIRNQELMFQQSKLASMGEMIGNIAHQWRQPLNSLALNLFAVDNKFNTDTIDKKHFHAFVEDSQKTIQHMSNTIDDFRDFFNPNKAKKSFKLSYVIDKTISFVHDSFKNHGITLTKMGDDDLEIFGYENEFAQVLINILNNSKDAILTNQIAHGAIGIQIQCKEERAIVTISDNGGGANNEIIERAFEPYFTTKEKKEGTGIGLYMSKMIIENSMNGSIRMEVIQKGMKTEIELGIGRENA